MQHFPQQPQVRNFLLNDIFNKVTFTIIFKLPQQPQQRQQPREKLVSLLNCSEIFNLYIFSTTTTTTTTPEPPIYYPVPEICRKLLYFPWLIKLAKWKGYCPQFTHYSYNPYEYQPSNTPNIIL